MFSAKTDSGIAKPLASVYRKRSRCSLAPPSKISTRGSGLVACLCASTMNKSASHDAAAAHADVTFAACFGLR